MTIWKSVLSHNWTDETYDDAVRYIKNGTLPEHYTKDMRKSFKRRIAMGYEIRDNKLVFITVQKPPWIQSTLQGTEDFVFKVVKPSEQKKILQQFFRNESVMALNYRTLYDKVLRSGYLAISRSDVQAFLKENPVHLRLMDSNPKPYVQSYRPNYPFEHWQMDFIDFRKLSDNNEDYNYILVIIDIFSKFIYLFPISGKSVPLLKETCNCLRKLFLSGDIPKHIGCDNQFNTAEFESLCKEYHIKPVYGMPHNPQTQGFVENKNKQIKGFIYLHFNRNQTFRYFDILDYIAFSINNTQHSMTKKTPNEIHRGRVLPLPNTDNIEVVSVPTEFDLNFPTLSEYNTANILSKSSPKSTKINIESLHYNETMVDAYDKSAQDVYKLNAENVRQHLHRIANKREMMYKKQTKTKYKHSDKIKIRTYLERDDEIQPVQLRLVEKNEAKTIHTIENPLYRQKIADPVLSISRQKVMITDIKRYPKTAFSKSVLTMSFDWKMPYDLKPIFQIVEIVQSSSKSYRLNTLDGKYIVEYMTSLKPLNYSRDFRMYMFHKVKYNEVNDAIPVRPTYTFKPISILGEFTDKHQQNLQNLRNQHKREVKALINKAETQKTLDNLLMLDHNVGNHQIDKTEFNDIVSAPGKTFEDIYVYCKTNWYPDYDDGIVLLHISKIRKNKNVLTIGFAKYVYFDKYSKTYLTYDAESSVYKTHRLRATNFRQKSSKFELSFNLDFNNYAQDQEIMNSAFSWVFAHPNVIRQRLELQLKDSFGNYI